MRIGGSGAAALLLLSVSSPVPAQRAVVIESLQVFGDRAPLLRADHTQAITVITRAQIEARRAATVPDLLREVAGLHLDRLGGAGPSNVYIRGAEPNHTVVLVDGIRMNDPTDVRGGSFDLGAISVDEIEVIEILRGASSAQFGADAIGGIVNIVTRRPHPGAGRAAASAGAGGNGYRQGSARISGASESIAAAAGFSRVLDGRDEDGGHSRRNAANASVAAGSGSRGELRLHARHSEGDLHGFPESSGGVRFAENRELERRASRENLAGLAYRIGARDGWQLSARLSRFERREDRHSPAVAPGPGGFLPETDARTDFDRTGFAAQSSWSRLPLDTTVVAGVEHLREDGRRDSVIRLGEDLAGAFDLARRTRSAFAQIEANPPVPLRLIAAIRHDRVDPGESRTSRSAGIRHCLSDNHSLRAHWSEGFKPPSFFALGDPLVGNPGLAPETSRSREVGWDFTSAGTRIQATAFSSRYENLVDFDPGTFRMVNRAGARVRGAEVHASTVMPGRVEVSASYTYVDAELVGTDAVLRNRPRHRGSLALAHEWGPWSARAAAVRVGESFDFSVPTGSVRLPAFTVVDLAAQWRREGLAIGLAVDNATDRGYESFVGFASSGRRIRVTVEIAM